MRRHHQRDGDFGRECSHADRMNLPAIADAAGRPVCEPLLGAIDQAHMHAADRREIASHNPLVRQLTVSFADYDPSPASSRRRCKRITDRNSTRHEPPNRPLHPL